MILYHFSEDPSIQRFDPRIINKETVAKVWTIDETHAPHYYFPRECPRVCVWPKEDTSLSDIQYFFGLSKTHRMIAIESAWYERVSKGHIYRYSFDPVDFQIHEPNAGYYISTRSVEPLNVERIDDLIGAIISQGIELRVTPFLQPLKEFIIKSSINFSMIRMRNALME